MAYKFQSLAANLSGALEQQGDVTFKGVLNLKGNLLPEEDNGADIGSSSKEWKDLYLDGIAYIDEARIDQLGAALDANSQIITNINVDSGNIDGTVIGAASPAAATVTTLVANGNVDLGDNTSDTITATGRFDSDLIPSTDSARKLGSSTLQWSELHLDQAFIDVLGSELDANAQNIIGINDLGVDGHTTLGSGSSSTVNFLADISSSMIPFTDNFHDLGASGERWGKVYVNKLHANELGRALDCDSQAMTNVNIDSGAIDGTAIGAAAQSTIKATTVSGSGNFSIGGNATVLGNILPDGDNVSDLGSSTREFKDLYLDGVAYLDSISLNGTALSATAAELNLLDGGTSVGASVTLVDSDGFVVNDAGTTKLIPVSDIKTYIGGGSVAVTSASAGFTGSVGINHFSDIGGAVECRMPALVAVGESVIFKAGKDCSTTNTITIKMSGSGKADDLSEVVLESPFAAVELACVAPDTTFIIL